MSRFLFLFYLALPLLGAPDWNTLFRSLVKVEAEKQPKDTGAGIVISASADSIRVLTAAHVVANATSLKVYFHSDRAVAYTATVLPNSSDALDLAVIEVLRPRGRALPGDIPQLEVRDRNTLQVTEHIWTVDSGWIPVPNNVTKLDHDLNTQQFEYTRGATNDGFSGGAVFDDDGRLAGIHDEGAAGGQYAVAVKLASAVEVLSALGHNTPNLIGIGTAVPNPGPGRGNPQPPKPGAGPPRVGDTRVNAKDGLTYVWIPAGSFTMGCSPGDNECVDSEKPPYQVNITEGFWIGQTEVTQEAYQKVKGQGKNPSMFIGAKLPVDSITWGEAQSFCRGAGMWLPTEAEWEYAARAGSKQSQHGDIDAIAWYQGNSGGKTHEVAQKAANAWGLFDTIGNVWEWTSDGYVDRLLSAVNDPIALSAGQYRMLRGGSWVNVPRNMHVSTRLPATPGYHLPNAGFRCVGELP